MKIHCVILFLFFCSAASAETTDKLTPPKESKKLISFEGFVQFAEGTSSVLSLGGEKEEVKYSTPIYEDTKIKLESNATIKFVTRQNCIVVAYGEGSLVGPQGEKPWRLTTKAVRFLCAEKSEEKFNFHGVEITPQGEILFEMTGKIFVVTGIAKLSQTLSSRKIYQISKTGINLDPANQSPQAQYNFDNLYKIPREGEKLLKPKTAIPIKYRLSFGPEFGPGIVIHANGYLNHYDYASGGPRLQFSFRDRDRDRDRDHDNSHDREGAYIIGFRYLQTDDHKNNSGGNYNYTPNGVVASDRLRSFGLDGGYRFHFDRWWSPFVHAGVTWMRNELNINSSVAGNNCGSSCGGYHSEQVLDYFGVSAGFGYDMLYRPTWLGGLGIFASTELELNQTVHPTTKSDRNVQSNTFGSVPNEATNEHGLISNLNALVHFGLLYQF